MPLSEIGSFHLEELFASNTAMISAVHQDVLHEFSAHHDGVEEIR